MSLLVEKNGAHPIESSSRVSAQERVLFAFCQSDRAQFFPAYMDSFPGEGERHWFDTKKITSPEYWSDFLREMRPTILVSCWSTPMLPISLLLSDSFPLRYLCHSAGTVKNKVPRDFLAKGGIVTNWGNLISHNVAEHALLLILASLRKLPTWRSSMARSKDLWGNAGLMQTQSLRGKKVGIHGIGNVASELIRLLQPFDVECRAFSHNVSPSYIRDKGCIPCRDLMELFQESDVVVECEGLTPQSANSVTEAHLRSMREGSLFVNVGRGAVVDESALVRVATEGLIYVGSDVFAAEPLPADSPLLTMENVIVSPHLAGPTGDWLGRCGEYAMENVDRYLAGQPLNGLVTLEIYDRTT